MDETVHSGAILTPDTISERDYILGGDSPLSVKIALAYNPNKVRRMFNQGLQTWSLYTCTICSAFTVLMYNTGQVYTMEDVKAVAGRMEKDGLFNPTGWAKLKDAIDYVRRYNNERSEIKVDSFQIAVWSAEHREAGAKNLAIQYGFFTSRDFYLDSQDDGIVSGVSFPKGWGHAVTDIDVRDTLDNYEGGKKYNEYELENMVALKNNGVIFPAGYIFLKQTYSMFTDVSENSPFYPFIKEMADKGIMKGQDGKFRPKDSVTREEMAVIISRLLALK